ncbi:MAG: GNAT family N-acetyltransferase [Candidatus Muirbacterium halophilum]|nr:GNAT family N-acetyltransferase [Candidatus Muirbacterium halophilum]MCK9475356.1 GNAT family N-acetyltransferase [Candidatus Muirbacterium halophilum]
MDNIILLKSKDKKKVYSFLKCHPLSTIFIKEVIENKGFINNSEQNHGDFYGIFKNNIIIGIIVKYNMGISIISGTSHANELSENFDNTNFIIKRKTKDKENIAKQETFMLYTKKTIITFNSYRVFIAKTKDIEELLKLRLEFEKEYWNYNPEKIDEEKFEKLIIEKVSKKEVLIYKLDNKIAAIGFCETENHKVILIGSIFVKNEFRGLGIGKTLTLGLCDYIIQKNKMPCLTVDINNIKAYNLYKNIGFKAISEIYLVEPNTKKSLFL